MLRGTRLVARWSRAMRSSARVQVRPSALTGLAAIENRLCLVGAHQHQLQAALMSSQSASTKAGDWHAVMARRKQHMGELAEANQWTQLIKVVLDCYAPLYKQHSTLQRMDNPLAALLDGDEAEVGAGAGASSRVYDDKMTKSTEEEFAALCVRLSQAPLAIAMYEHRQRVAAAIGQDTVAGANVLEDGAINFAHNRMFYSWMCSAYALAHQEEQVLAVYQDAQDHRRYPTASMNTTYVNALLVLGRFDEIKAFFADVRANDHPTNIFFYRQILFSAHVMGAPELVPVVLSTMKIKGFGVRAIDYLNAIRAYDKRYFLTDNVTSHKTDSNKPARVPHDTFVDWLRRVREREQTPDVHAEQLEASSAVLSLFSDMVDDEHLEPRNTKFYPRVMTAALWLEMYDRIPEFLEMHALNAEAPLDLAAINAAVNGLLLGEQPAQAWELVQQRYPQLGFIEFACVKNILEYCAVRRDVSVMQEVLAAVAEADKLKFISVKLVKRMTEALCEVSAELDDEALWQLMVKYEELFQVRTNMQALATFLRASCRAQRLDIAKRAIDEHQSKHKHVVKSNVAMLMIQQLEALEEWESVLRVFRATDMRGVDEERATQLRASAVAACNKLGKHAEAKKIEAKPIQGRRKPRTARSSSA